jgi:hypothetical protein
MISFILMSSILHILACSYNIMFKWPDMKSLVVVVAAWPCDMCHLNSGITVKFLSANLSNWTVVIATVIGNWANNLL